MNKKLIAANNLKLFKTILNELQIFFLLDGGTCLGVYRDNDFCEDDENDIDLTTDDKYSILIPNIIESSEKKGFKLYHNWDVPGFSTRQISFKKDDIKIDLMFKKQKNTFTWWTVFKGNKIAKYKKVPSYFYQMTQEIIFYNEKYFIPYFIEEYLTYRYGNWKIPIHRNDYSCYSTDKCIINGGYEEI